MRRLSRVLIAPAVAAALAAPARADPATAPAANPAPASNLNASNLNASKPAPAPIAVPDVIITSRHRKERAQSVPIAITSVDARQLSVGAITSVDKLSQLVPSLQVTEFNPRNTSFNIRGIGNQVALANDGLEDGVGVYVDGVFVARPAQATFALPDIAGIDVLRGPQGTLFGKNTTAGAVDIHTRPPSFTPTAELDTSLGNYGYDNVTGYVSGPIGPGQRAAGSIAVLDENRDGFITNPVTRQHYQGEHQRAVRAQLELIPTDNLTVRIIADYSQQTATCCVSIPVTVLTRTSTGLPYPSAFAQRVQGLNYTIPDFGPFNRNTDVNSPVFFNTETGGVSADATLTLADGSTLSSITAWRFWNFDPHNDLDDLGLDIQAANNQTDFQRQASQEFRLVSPDNRRLSYTVGLYYFYQDIPGTLRIQYGSAAGPYLVAPILGPGLAASLGGPALNGYTLDSATDVRTNSEAAYGQARLHITPTLDLTAGLRGTLEQKTGSFDQTASGGQADNAIADLIQQTVEAGNSAVNNYTAHANDAIGSGIATLSYHPTTDTLFYATYDRGEKTSGINNDGVPAGVSPVIKPERVDDTEAGIKTSAFSNRAIFAATAYWIEDFDYQAEIANFSGNSLLTYLANVPKVRSRGFELDAKFRPTANIQLFASGVYDDAIYESFHDGICPIELASTGTCDLTGRPLPGTPKFALTLGGEIDQPIGHKLIAYGAADLSLRTGTHTTPDDSNYTFVPGTGILDLQVGVRPTKGRWDLSVFIRNALNQNTYQYLTVATPNAGLIVGAPADPLTFGATLKIKL